MNNYTPHTHTHTIVGRKNRRFCVVLSFPFAVIFFLHLSGKSFGSELKTISESFSIYGYGLFDFCITTEDKEKGKTVYNAPIECRKGGSFAQALFAPFLEFIPTSRIRVLSELEVKYAPELEAFGEIEKEAEGEEVEYKTKGADKFKFEGFGEIDFSYVFIEYIFSDYFTIRAGKFLNPFGLLLERRDAQPTYLFLFLPQLYQKHKFGGKYSESFISDYNVGLQIRGKSRYFGYTLYVANGRGSVANVIDANDDKGLGVHTYFQVPEGRFFGSRVGFDFYTDKNFEKQNTRQNTFGGHFILSVREIGPGNLELSGEVGLTQILKSPIVERDITAISGYGLISYSLLFDSFQVSPYFAYDFIDLDTKASEDSTSVLYFGLALNPSPYLRIKIELHNQIPEKGKSVQIFGLGLSYAF